MKSMNRMPIEKLLREITDCQENCTSRWGVETKEPLVGGSRTSKILIVSQDPSSEAWEKHELFGKENPTARQFARDVFGVSLEKFNKSNFAWIHISNCDTGKYKNRGDRRPNPNGYCAKKFVKRFIKTLEPKFMVLIGTCALDHFFKDANRDEFLCSLDKNWEGIPLQFIYHPSGKARILNKPEVREKQKRAINKIKEAIWDIL